MGVSLTLKHIKELGQGRFEYRRRVPESAKGTMQQGEFKRVFSANSPSALAREHARIDAEFDRAVMQAKRGREMPSKATPREIWEAALREAQRLTEGAIGLDREEAGVVVAEMLEESGTSSPVLAMALRDPHNLSEDNPLPGHTLEDARNLYIKEKLGGGQGNEHREALARVERVMQRVSEALGDDARTRPLDKLKREDARKVRDHMLQSPRKGGGVLSPSSVKRELKTLSAMINFGLREFDLGGVVNPFDSLPVTGGGGSAAMPDADKRDPLPAPVVAAMSSRLKGDLRLIWRVLAGTGCRLGEVTGLRNEDVILSGPIPHIRVTWHEGRRLKTKASIRSVPLVGDSLAAAKEALSDSSGDGPLFSSYAHPRGADGASAALMKHLRKVSPNPKHVVHSLRHGMKDALRLAGVEKPLQDLILGHASPSIGETYGGEAVRLQVAHRALIKALEEGEDVSPSGLTA
jgi:integrase